MTKANAPTVGVVCGGASAEAEVSRVSGRGVADALRATYDNVVLLELDASIASSLRDKHVDVVFPALHGPPGEDGTFQGFLETMEIPYVGSNVHASAYAMDKIVAKHLFRGAGLPVAKDIIVDQREDVALAAQRSFTHLGSDVVVKPARQGSALGVTFAKESDELIAALEFAFEIDDRVIIEQRIKGKEATVGILDIEQLEALPTIEIETPPNEWYDYAHRYTVGMSNHIIPANISDDQRQRAEDIARQAHFVLGCRDLSRVDFVVPERGDPIVLEVNTLPGMTPTSLYPDAAQAFGLNFETLVAKLIERALTRGHG